MTCLRIENVPFACFQQYFSYYREFSKNPRKNWIFPRLLKYELLGTRKWLVGKKRHNKKALAADAGFDASNITKGIKNNNCPSAETAVRIAARLGVSVEYLVTGKISTKNNADAKKSVYLYQKYHNVIETLENLPNNKQQAVMRIVEECGKLGKWCQNQNGLSCFRFSEYCKFFARHNLSFT